MQINDNGAMIRAKAANVVDMVINKGRSLYRAIEKVNVGDEDDTRIANGSNKNNLSSPEQLQLKVNRLRLQEKYTERELPELRRLRDQE